MDESEFWRLIDDSIKSSSGDWWMDAEEQLVGRLQAYKPDGILAFQGQMIDVRNRAYSWDLRGAADLMLGRECNFDEFDFFLAWIIGMGRDVYVAALTDPDSLAGAIPADGDEDWEPNSEPLINVVATSYERVTGESFPWSTGPEYLKEPHGSRIDGKHLGRRFPRIKARIKARG